MEVEEAYNVQIWVGLKVTHGEEKLYTINDVYNICDDFVKDGDCVSVTKTSMMYTNGFEDGATIGFINYPRFPKSKEEILKRALKLAELLMINLSQYKVTVTTPQKSIMLSNPKVKREI